MNKLEEIVYLVNKGSKVNLKWDGKEFSLNKNQKREVKRGVAEHFKAQNDKLEIEEIEEEEVEAREVNKEKESNEEAFEELEGE